MRVLEAFGLVAAILVPMLTALWFISSSLTALDIGLDHNTERLNKIEETVEDVKDTLIGLVLKDQEVIYRLETIEKTYELVQYKDAMGFERSFIRHIADSSGSVYNGLRYD